MKKNIFYSAIFLCSFLIVSGNPAAGQSLEISFIKLGDTVIPPSGSSGSNSIIGSDQQQNGSISFPANLATPLFEASPGDAVNLTLASTPYSGTKYWRIWIDLNADGDYLDPMELVYDSGPVLLDSVSGTFTVPPGNLHTYSYETSLLIGLAITPNPQPSNLVDSEVVEFRDDHFVVELDDAFSDNLRDNVEGRNEDHGCILVGQDGNVELEILLLVNLWSTKDPDQNPSISFPTSTKVKLKIYDYFTGLQVNNVYWRNEDYTLESTENPGAQFKDFQPSNPVVRRSHQRGDFYLYHNQDTWEKDLIFPASAPNIYIIEFTIEDYPSPKEYSDVLAYDQHVQSFPLLIGDCTCSNLPASIVFPSPDAFPPVNPLVRATQTIEASGSVTISSGQHYLFQAGNEVRLQDGFHAQAGSDFRAYIAPCVPEDNPVHSRQAAPSSQSTNPTLVHALNLQVLPNPVMNHALVRMDLEQETTDPSSVRMKLVNNQGQVLNMPILQSKWSGRSLEKKIDLHALPAGLYWLSVQTPHTVETIPILKK
ncbi:MAG: T9SS type A sorting domain-containing protein [Bacteroidota bacterium]